MIETPIVGIHQIQQNISCQEHSKIWHFSQKGLRSWEGETRQQKTDSDSLQ